MRTRTQCRLKDIEIAIGDIESFTEGAGLADYRENRMMRSAVERQLPIIGEAVAAISRMSPGAAARITAATRIISFRNRLIHDYGEVDDETVWKIVRDDLPVLRREVAGLLPE